MFERYVIKTDSGCWGWTGPRDSGGYGTFCSREGTIKAHRYSFKEANPTVDIEGLSILHSCHNPECSNPDHLTAGNADMNAYDMVASDRELSGARNPRAKLTEEEARVIFWLSWTSSMTTSELAASFGVGVSTITEIKGRTRWRKVTQQLADQLGIVDQPSKETKGKKLTPEQVMAIYNLVWSKTRTYRSIARQFGVTSTMVKFIRNGHSWSGVTGHQRNSCPITCQ